LTFLASSIPESIVLPVFENFFLNLFWIDLVEGNLDRKVGFGPVEREGTVEEDLRSPTPFPVLWIGKGIKRGPYGMFIFPDPSDRMAFCGQGMDDIILIIDICFLIDHDDHLKPGAQLTSKDQVGDLGCNIAIDGPDAYHNHVMGRFGKHEDASDGDALALQKLSHL
jgi:hypothetical protein